MPVGLSSRISSAYGTHDEGSVARRPFCGGVYCAGAVDVAVAEDAARHGINCCDRAGTSETRRDEDEASGECEIPRAQTWGFIPSRGRMARARHGEDNNMSVLGICSVNWRLSR